jgi:tRNA A37 threonylcarbamoyladenosine modification protein TsaB
MGLTLGISTSCPQFEVIIGENTNILFSSAYTIAINDKKDIAFLVAEGLKQMGLTTQDITNIIVDIGPGGTSLVRTGVAFANGLSYSLGIPICPVSSVETIGFEAWNTYKLPVICTVKSIKDTAYVALYDGKLVKMKYGVLETVVAELTEGIEAFVVAGVHRPQLLAAFSHKILHDSGLQFGKAKYLIEQSALWADRFVSFPAFPQPITEQSAHLYA